MKTTKMTTKMIEVEEDNGDDSNDESMTTRRMTETTTTATTTTNIACIAQSTVINNRGHFPWLQAPQKKMAASMVNVECMELFDLVVGW